MSLSLQCSAGWCESLANPTSFGKLHLLPLLTISPFLLLEHTLPLLMTFLVSLSQELPKLILFFGSFPTLLGSHHQPTSFLPLLKSVGMSLKVSSVEEVVSTLANSSSEILRLCFPWFLFLRITISPFPLSYSGHYMTLNMYISLYAKSKHCSYSL